jgi:hypothetical protein
MLFSAVGQFEKTIPPGLKPRYFCDLRGTAEAEAVPFQNISTPTANLL